MRPRALLRNKRSHHNEKPRTTMKSSPLSLQLERKPMRSNKDPMQPKKKKKPIRDFPGSPVVKMPHFQCRGHGFDPWLGN